MAIRPQCSRVVLSYYQESDLAASPSAQYGTPVPDTNIDKMFEPTEPVLLALAQNRIDDAEMIKGHEFPQDTELDMVIAQDISIPFSFPLSTSLAGLLFALALGDYTVTDLGDGNYKHSNKALSVCVTDQLPSSSWILGLVGDDNSKFRVKGLVINELKLALESAGRLTISGTAFTDGTLTAVPGYVWPTTLASDVWPLASSGDFLINGVSQKAILRSFDFSINNNNDLADGRSNIINSGIFLSELRLGNRSYELSVTLDGHQGSPIWNAWLAGTVMEFDISVQYDANHKIVINFPKIKISQCTQRFDGIRDVLDCTIKVFYDTVDATPITIDVYNRVPEYLTLHGTLSAGVSPSSSESPSPSGSESASSSVSQSPSVSVSPSV